MGPAACHRMARRKKRSRRRSKVFHINAIETGAALSLIQSTNAAAAVQLALAGGPGSLTAGFDTISNAVATNKSKIIGTMAATAVAKMLTKGFRPRLAKLGPISIGL